MKRLIPLLILTLGCCASLYAENPSPDLLSSPASDDRIQLPDVQYSITDESAVPLDPASSNGLRDAAPDYGRIELEELSRVRATERLFADAAQDRKKDNFSLSSFKLYYGLPDQLMAELNAGKRMGNLSYLLSYLRNRRSNVYDNGQESYNTALEVDDLGFDLLWNPLAQLDLSWIGGYYSRSLGLSDSPYFLTESRRYVPMKLGAVWGIDTTSRLKFQAEGSYLLSDHENTATVSRSEIWEGRVQAGFEANYSRDNFLKIRAEYGYLGATNLRHSGYVSVVDRFPLGQYSLQVGGETRFYSDRSFFWAPNLFLNYRPTNGILLQAGVSGDSSEILSDKLLAQNQIEPVAGAVLHEWQILAQGIWQPLVWLSFRGNVVYHAAESYPGLVYDSSSALYRYENITNVQYPSAEAAMEISPGEDLNFSLSYQFRYQTELLFFPMHRVKLAFDWKIPSWGFQMQIKLGYDSEFLEDADVRAAASWPLDITLTEALSKDVFIELKGNNLLNQELSEKPLVPKGGVNGSLGIRILL